MKFTIVFSLLAASAAIASPVAKNGGSSKQNNGSNGNKGAINPALVPQFGITAGQGRVGASCTGANGVLIPCQCPPNRNDFIKKLQDIVDAGNIFGSPIQFNNDANDKSVKTQQQRATVCIIVLQSFSGSPGKGCPAASAPDFLSQQKTGIAA